MISEGRIRTILMFSVAVATEAEDKRTQITVAAHKNGTPVASSGYTLGMFQFDFGQRGTDKGYFTDGKTIAEALGDEVNAWAAANGKPLLSLPTKRGTGDDFTDHLISHNAWAGKNEKRHRVSWFKKLPDSDLALIREWGHTERGRSWIKQKLENPVMAELTKVANHVLDTAAVKKWTDDDQSLGIALITKVFNQNPNYGNDLVDFLRSDPAATVDDLEKRYHAINVGYLAGGKAKRIQGLMNQMSGHQGLKVLVDRAITAFRDPVQDRFDTDPGLIVMRGLFADGGTHGLHAILEGSKRDVQWTFAFDDGSKGTYTYRAKDQTVTLLTRNRSYRLDLANGEVLVKGPLQAELERAPATGERANPGVKDANGEVATSRELNDEELQKILRKSPGVGGIDDQVRSRGSDRPTEVSSTRPADDHTFGHGFDLRQVARRKRGRGHSSVARSEEFSIYGPDGALLETGHMRNGKRVGVVTSYRDGSGVLIEYNDAGDAVRKFPKSTVGATQQIDPHAQHAIDSLLKSTKPRQQFQALPQH